MRQRNTRYNIANAVAAAVAGNMIQPYVGILAIRLGADNLQLGYLSSWPNLISVVAVLGLAAAVAQSNQKQRLIAAIFLIGRAAALGAAAVPWFPEPMKVWALIGFWTLSVFPTSAAGSALQSFLADVFPGSERTRAFAARQSWGTAAGMVVVLVTGGLLDYVFPQPLGYQLMFAGSFLFALLEVFFFMQLKEVDLQSTVEVELQSTVEAHLPPAGVAPAREGGGGWRSYLAVFQHKPFVQFLICSIPFHFAWQMAWPLFTRYQVSELHISNSMISMVTVANSLVAALTYPLWARWAEKRGNKVMMFQAAVQLAAAPVLTAMAPTAFWLLVVNLLTGIGVSGVMLLVLNNLLDVSPNEERPVYVAVHSALVSVSAAVAPMVGAFLMEALPIRTGLLLSSGLRLLMAGLFYIWMLRATRGKGNALEAANLS